jgi:hypothetical protein
MAFGTSARHTALETDRSGLAVATGRGDAGAQAPMAASPAKQHKRQAIPNEVVGQWRLALAQGRGQRGHTKLEVVQSDGYNVA